MWIVYNHHGIYKFNLHTTAHHVWVTMQICNIYNTRVDYWDLLITRYILITIWLIASLVLASSQSCLFEWTNVLLKSSITYLAGLCRFLHYAERSLVPEKSEFDVDKPVTTVGVFLGLFSQRVGTASLYLPAFSNSSGCHPRLSLMFNFSFPNVQKTRVIIKRMRNCT